MMACWLTFTILLIQLSVLSGAPSRTKYNNKEIRNITTNCSVKRVNRTLYYELSTSIICKKTIEINECGGYCPSISIPTEDKLIVSWSLCQAEDYTFQHVKLDCSINGKIKKDVKMKVQMITSCACKMYMKKKRRRKIRSYSKLAR